MPAVHVNIQPEIINWVLNQIRVEQLGEKFMEKVYMWRDGIKNPTFNQIEYFSKKTHIPLGYFFLEKPPIEDLNLIEYRTIDSIELSNPSRDLIDTLSDMENIQTWMKAYRQETGFDALSIVGSLKDNNDVEYMADKIRTDLDLRINWYEECKNMNDSFNHIRILLEECGITVMLNGIVRNNTHRPLNVNEFRAFAMVDEWAPLIFINSADSYGARLFSLFHEVTHIWLGENDLFNDRRNNQIVKPLETLCNKVASELLVPYKKFIYEWESSSITDLQERISVIARFFKCSESVISRKAYDLKLISFDMYSNIVEESIAAYKESRENKEAGNGNYYNTMVSRIDGCFMRALCESIHTGRTTFTEAFRLTNTNRKTFAEIANRLGGIV